MEGLAKEKRKMKSTKKIEVQKKWRSKRAVFFTTQKALGSSKKQFGSPKKWGEMKSTKAALSENNETNYSTQSVGFWIPLSDFLRGRIWGPKVSNGGSTKGPEPEFLRQGEVFAFERTNCLENIGF